MATGHSRHSPGIFAITKLKLFLIVSLAFTWWLAANLPHYRPMIKAHIKSRIDEARQKIPKIKVDWVQEEDDDPRDAYNASKVALLIEPRPLPHLVPQILHMISVVPPDWRFLFIGSNLSVVSVGRAYATKHQQVIGKLDLMVLPEPWEIETKEKVFRMLTDPRFYDEFLPEVEWLLKYESDSIMCANSQESLNDWLHWHWAGAPRTQGDRFSGNGGLSLRRVSAIKRVLEFQSRYNNTEPEDEWFGKRMYILPGAKVASGDDGMLAVEDVYMENPMGFHVREGGAVLADAVWKDYEQRQDIFEYCPELSLIMDMKLERERCPGDDKEGVIVPTPEEIAAEKAKKAAEEAARKKAEEAAKKIAAAAAAEKAALESVPSAAEKASGPEETLFVASAQEAKTEAGETDTAGEEKGEEGKEAEEKGEEGKEEEEKAEEGEEEGGQGDKEEGEGDKGEKDGGEDQGQDDQGQDDQGQDGGEEETGEGDQGHNGEEKEK